MRCLWRELSALPLLRAECAASAPWLAANTGIKYLNYLGMNYQNVGTNHLSCTKSHPLCPAVRCSMRCRVVRVLVGHARAPRGWTPCCARSWAVCWGMWYAVAAVVQALEEVAAAAAATLPRTAAVHPRTAAVHPGRADQPGRTLAGGAEVLEGRRKRGRRPGSKPMQQLQQQLPPPPQQQPGIGVGGDSASPAPVDKARKGRRSSGGGGKKKASSGGAARRLPAEEEDFTSLLEGVHLVAAGPVPRAMAANFEPYFQNAWRREPFEPRCAAWVLCGSERVSLCVCNCNAHMGMCINCNAPSSFYLSLSLSLSLSL